MTAGPEWYDLAVLVLRVSIGVMLVAHGLNHWLGGGKIAGTARWFESLGLRPGKVHAWASVLAEVVAGAGLAAGLLTPLCAGAGIALMTVAIVTVHQRNGFWVLKEGWEYTGLVAVTCAVLATLGPGRWSLDQALGVDGWLGASIAGANGLAVALVSGLGGAALLLAACWRPSQKTPA